jgi:DNA-binding Lrp family transcriptional regulator
MGLSREDKRLLAALEDGLALVPRPFAAAAARLGCGEEAVIERLRALCAASVVHRFGVIVRHHELGYRANAMVVWDVPEESAREAGQRLAALPSVTLAYRRRPAPPAWPYTLYCMIHGRDRAAVESRIEEATRAAGLEGAPRAVLFSRRRFKQRGPRYARQEEPA